MRKEQDYFFKKAKKDNYPARSVYKLEEAQQKYKFLKKKQRVLDLGCHPGSWSMYASTIVGAWGVVVGVDLQHTDIPSQKDNILIGCDNLGYGRRTSEICRVTKPIPLPHILYPISSYCLVIEGNE